MDKRGKRVDVVRAVHDHTVSGFKRRYGHCEATHYENGVPVLIDDRFMLKRVIEYTPTHDCPDWARDEADDDHMVETESGEIVCVDGGRVEYIYRYDEKGDQVCVNCGDIRNQSPGVVHDHQHAGRYDGFGAGHTRVAPR